MPSSASSVGSIFVVSPAVDSVFPPVMSPRVSASPVSGSVATTVLGSNVGSTLAAVCPLVAGAAVVGAIVVGVVSVVGVERSIPVSPLKASTAADVVPKLPAVSPPTIPPKPVAAPT